MVTGRTVHSCYHFFLCPVVIKPYFIIYLDGKSTGPMTFSGRIVKSIAGQVESLEVVSFPIVPHADFPEMPRETEATSAANCSCGTAVPRLW